MEPTPEQEVLYEQYREYRGQENPAEETTEATKEPEMTEFNSAERIEYIYLRGKKNSYIKLDLEIKQLIRDCLEEVKPERKWEDSIAALAGNTQAVGNKMFNAAIRKLEANIQRLLG